MIYDMQSNLIERTSFWMTGRDVGSMCNVQCALINFHLIADDLSCINQKLEIFKHRRTTADHVCKYIHFKFVSLSLGLIDKLARLQTLSQIRASTWKTSYTVCANTNLTSFGCFYPISWHAQIIEHLVGSVSMQSHHIPFVESNAFACDPSEWLWWKPISSVSPPHIYLYMLLDIN